MGDADTNEWESMIVPERMAADQEFQERVYGSSLSTQSWGLVMMAVEFEVAAPSDPGAAHLAADTSQLETVMPAMRRAEAELGETEGGILQRLRDTFGSDPDAERRAEAERLVDEYAQLLTRHLEAAGKWEDVRTAASEAS